MVVAVFHQLAMLVKAGGIIGMVPLTDEEHSRLLNDDLHWTAITKILTPILIVILISGLVIFVRRKKRNKQYE